MTWFGRKRPPVAPMVTATEGLVMVRAGHRVEVVGALVDPRYLPAFWRGLGANR